MEEEAVLGLVWEDLTVELSVKSNRKKLLNNLSGYAQPGKILAVMGPSGSGKTTLLDSFAGRLSGKRVMTGNVSLYGRRPGPKTASYVPQEDVYIGVFTVRETLTYAAHLKLSAILTKEAVNELVDDTIIDMGLQDCADSKIGNWHLRGLSTGEKKRLSIGLELLVQPQLLLLDEPTSGLDTAGAFFIIHTLRKVADDGKIVILSIHQPNSDIFNLFDHLLLLSCGEAVFLGELNSALQFFADSGFPCPRRMTPSDHFLRCINSDFDILIPKPTTMKNITSPACSNSQMNLTATKTRTMLIENFSRSEYNTRLRQKLRQASLQEQMVRESITQYDRPNSWKQFRTLTHRSFRNMTRDLGYYWIRMAAYIGVSMALGNICYQEGHTQWSVLSGPACNKLVFSFLAILAVGGISFFTEELKVYYHERRNTNYSAEVYVLSNLISSLPFLIATSIISATILFFTMKFQHDFSSYAFTLVNLFGTITLLESCMMSIAAMVPDPLAATGWASGTSIFLVMSSAYLRPITDIPRIFWRYPMSYITFISWAMEGQHKNDLLGHEFKSVLPGEEKLSGHKLLKILLGNHIDRSKWWDLAVVIFLSFTYRLFLYLVLKYKSRVLSLVDGLSTKINFSYSFLYPKRKLPPYSLSSQEGLRSPIQ